MNRINNLDFVSLDNLLDKVINKEKLNEFEIEVAKMLLRKIRIENDDLKKLGEMK